MVIVMRFDTIDLKETIKLVFIGVTLFAINILSLTRLATTENKYCVLIVTFDNNLAFKEDIIFIVLMLLNNKVTSLGNVAAIIVNERLALAYILNGFIKSPPF
jgi:hypothetical protein